MTSSITFLDSAQKKSASSNIYKRHPLCTHNGFSSSFIHSLRSSSPSMRAFLLSTRYLTQPILSKTVHRMGSITSPRELPRELRTLAECHNLAISAIEDDVEIRAKYRPFLLDPEVEATDWISQLELDTVISIAEKDLEKTGSRLKVLVLYGSLRKRYSTHHSLCQFSATNIG